MSRQEEHGLVGAALRYAVTQFPMGASRCVFVAGVLLFGLCGRMASADSNDLRLEGLAAEGGFAIRGLEWIRPEPARDEQGSVPDRLSSLLQDYNYVLIHDEHGGIEKILITSRKIPEAKGSADGGTVYTVRVGSRHHVEAAIAGPNGTVRTVRLMIDTGATTLVLPTSMIFDLGFAPEDLKPGILWALSGPLTELAGTLRSVRVGTVSADNIKVSFISDQQLRGTKLLGMSFLQHFRMTIDDERNELVLLSK